MRSLYFSALAVFGMISALVVLAVRFEPPLCSELEWVLSGEQLQYPVVSNRFRAEKNPEASTLFYEWEDHQGQNYALNFALADADVLASDLEFGYIPKALERYIEENAAQVKTEMIRHLREFALKRIAKNEYSDYFYIEDTGYERFNLRITIPGGEDPKLSDNVKIEFKKISKVLEKERQRYLPRLIKEENKHRKEYLKNCGLRLKGNRIMVDYRQVVNNNRPRVLALVESLRPLVKKKSLRGFISLLLAHVQTMDYGTPPEKEGDKAILGFWPPPKVLINNLGDCDSKAATFAAIWFHFKKYPLLFVTIPDHLLLGIAVPSFRGENVIINGMRYTFCEVAGPSLIPAGLITRYSRFHLESGQFHYEMIH